MMLTQRPPSWSPVVSITDGPVLISGPAVPFETAAQRREETARSPHSCEHSDDCRAHAAQQLGPNPLSPTYSCLSTSYPCQGHDRAAPETRGACSLGRCVPISSKTHVYDVAAREVLLPSIASAAPAQLQAPLRALIKSMLSADPISRPSFSEAVAEVLKMPGEARCPPLLKHVQQPHQSHAAPHPRPHPANHADYPHPANRTHYVWGRLR